MNLWITITIILLIVISTILYVRLRNRRRHNDVYHQFGLHKDIHGKMNKLNKKRNHFHI